MRPFEYKRVAEEKEAIAVVSPQAGTAFLAGGTTLIDLMKLGAVSPQTLVDINRLSLADVRSPGGGALIGALASNTDVASHPLILERFPVLSEAILSGATVQLRNMATIGGNLMQRTRCPYFRDPSLPCNKRSPGSGCPAIDGYNRGHAILGTSEHCVAVHPSDMCVALLALDAIIHTRSQLSQRQIPIKEFYLVPGNHPEQETVLQHGELITAVELPPSDFAAHSHYLKVRDRHSFAFALVSVAACLDIHQGKIAQARIVLGGVATKPWRVEASERLLIGKPPGKEAFAAAASAAVKGAKPLKHNKFKVELARRSIISALQRAAGGAV